ncbi:MAG: hypothetical protein AABY74_02855, partial [Planctomycetota bacterium]
SLGTCLYRKLLLRFGGWNISFSGSKRSFCCNPVPTPELGHEAEFHFICADERVWVTGRRAP